MSTEDREDFCRWQIEAKRDPALAASALEEIFRFASPIERQRAARRGGLARYASVDVEVDGITIRAGDTVMFAVQDANEDEGVFPTRSASTSPASATRTSR
ncbi:MAG TPA: hypothetical protein VGO16_09065 [Pseudonocardiaceae bacterium]|nr:hypothetical protein [Pseudonocardiaceae bacterium]